MPEFKFSRTPPHSLLLYPLVQLRKQESKKGTLTWLFVSYFHDAHPRPEAIIGTTSAEILPYPLSIGVS